MEVYLIRHTTPDITKGTIYGGGTDMDVSETFSSEMLAIKELVPGDLDVIYSSPMLRCKRLTRELPSQRVIFDKDLKEYHFGDWEGNTWDDLSEETNTWMNDWVNTRPPGGETLLEMQRRVLDVWNSIIEHPGKKIAVVAHAVVIRLIWAHEKRINLEKLFDIKIEYGGVLKLDL